jgi:ABC-type phosphate/phosphonate transport system permease subunit
LPISLAAIFFIIYFVFQSTLKMEDKYLQDISEIKNMMNKSSQFISLSGLAGILAGVYALIGAFVSSELLRNHDGQYITLESSTFILIALTAFLVLLLSVVTAIILTFGKANKKGEKAWNATSKRMIINFLIPLVTGGIFALLLLKNEIYGLIAPVTLLFYGMSCVNASKYTFRDIRYLGITIIILGLLATEFSGYALEFWALGFGVCHILYGSIMYYKYDRK